MKQRGKITLLPVNGLVNRLRAIASAVVWAENHKLDLEIYWKRTPLVFCEPADIFNRSFVNKYFISGSKDLENFYELPAKEKYEIGIDNVLWIAGGHKGEQKFMFMTDSYFNNDKGSPKRVILKSGGLFHDCGNVSCVDCRNFMEERREVYEMMGESMEVALKVKRFKERMPGLYAGIHVRTTDLSKEKRLSTFRIMISASRLASAKSQEPNRFFLCGDSLDSVKKIARLLRIIRYESYFDTDMEYDRAKRESAIDAYVDFQLLSMSEAIVGTRHSSFAYEACVFGGSMDTSFILEPHFQKTTKVINRARFALCNRSFLH